MWLVGKQAGGCGLLAKEDEAELAEVAMARCVTVILLISAPSRFKLLSTTTKGAFGYSCSF
jgi:hypothetical protein